MRVRFQIRCESCGEDSLLVIGVPHGDQVRMVFECPCCPAILRGVVHTGTPDGIRALTSEDFQTVEPEHEGTATGGLPISYIYLDLPIHRGAINDPATSAMSPVMRLIMYLDDGVDPELLFGSVRVIRQRREQIYPAVRRCAHLAQNRDLDALAECLDLESQRGERYFNSNPLHLFHNMLAMSYPPTPEYDEVDIWDRWVPEFHEIMERAEQRDSQIFEGLIEEIDEMDSFQRRRMVAFETTIRALDKTDAMTPAICYYLFSDDIRDNIGDFRIHRDDFDELKSTFQDSFELGSKILAFYGAFLNLALRGDPEELPDGSSRSIQETLRSTAYDREGILDELPELQPLYGQVRRGLRNQIGHADIHYNIETGMVESDEGEQPFMEFLVDYMAGIHMLGFVMTFVKFIDLQVIDA